MAPLFSGAPTICGFPALWEVSEIFFYRQLPSGAQDEVLHRALPMEYVFASACDREAIVSGLGPCDICESKVIFSNVRQQLGISGFGYQKPLPLSTAYVYALLIVAP